MTAPLDPAPPDAVAAATFDDAEFYRWYGPWAPFSPAEVATVLEGIGAAWWIVGGWAIDAFTGVAREHEDVDVAFLSRDLAAVLDHLAPAFCVWSNLSGTIRPLRRPNDLIDGSRQLWVRRDGASPWVMDLAMTQHDGDSWISNRDERVRRPLAETTFTAADGIRYLQPELVLFMKAKFARSKDERDLDLTLPRLSPDARGWLRHAIERVHPGHRWLERIAG